MRQIAREIIVEQADGAHLFAVDLTHTRKGEGLKARAGRRLLYAAGTGASRGKERVDFFLS
jgi:hypothetical protein